MKKLTLLLIGLLALILVAGCGHTKESDILGQYYYTSTTNVKDTKGEFVKVVYVITLSKEESVNTYKFTQDQYTIGRKGHHIETGTGTWDEKNATLTIGKLKPFVYDEKTKQINWAGDTLIPLTDKTKGDLEKDIAYAQQQKLY